MTMARLLPIDRDSVYLFPPSVQDWLPATHLARYIANVIESLDLSGSNAPMPDAAVMPNHPNQFHGVGLRPLFLLIRPSEV